MNKFYSLVFTLLSIAAFGQNPPEYEMSTTVVNDTIGILYDDGGKNDTYSDGRNYVFTITSSNGRPVNIKFTEFDLETNDINQPGLCIYDYIRVYDGVDTSATATRYCGQTAPPDFTSTGASVTIHMISDGATNGAGFKMLWSTSALPKVPVNYCEASGPDCSTAFTNIVEFDFNTFNNTSQICPGNPNDPSYQDFTNLIIDYEIGGVINVGGIIDGALGTEVVDVYIDWNGDGDFEDDNEKTTTVNQGIATEAFIGAIPPPSDYKLGLTRLRVRLWDPTFELGVLGPCGSSDEGEVEDYTLKIVDPDNPIPSCATQLSPVDGAVNQCTHIDFVWNTSADATSYNFRITTSSGAEVTSNEGLTDTTFSFAGLSPSTDYFWTVEAVNDNGVSFGCTQFSFTTGVASPVVGFNPNAVSICENSDFTFSANASGGDGAYTYEWSGPAAVILDDVNATLPKLADKSVRPATDLYVQVEDARGCTSNVDTLAVTVKAVQLAAEINLLDAVQCFSDNFKYLYPTGSYLFQESRDSIVWNNYQANRLGGDTVEFALSTADTVYLRNINIANGCADTSTVVMQVVLPALEKPEIDLFEGELTNCVGTKIQAQAANYDDGIDWSTGEQTDTISINATTDLFYSHTDLFGCSVSSDTINIEVIQLDEELTLNFSEDTLTICEGESVLLITNNDNAVWSDVAATVNDSLTTLVEGNYYATVNIGNCRFGSDTIFVKVNPNPDPVVLSFEIPTRLCLGLDSVEITAVSDFTWINPNVNAETITVFESGEYYGMLENEFGCIALSDTASIVFNEAPSKPVITLANDTLLTTVAAEDETVIWLYNTQIVLNGPGEDSLYVSQNGTYQVLIVSAASCPSEISDDYIYNRTGITQPREFAQTTLFPNPSNGKVALANLPAGEKTYSLIDAMGKVVTAGKELGKQLNLDLNVSTGSYLLIVTSEAGDTARYKLVIQ